MTWERKRLSLARQFGIACWAGYLWPSRFPKQPNSPTLQGMRPTKALKAGGGSSMGGEVGCECLSKQVFLRLPRS